MTDYASMLESGEEAGIVFWGNGAAQSGDYIGCLEKYIGFFFPRAGIRFADRRLADEAGDCRGGINGRLDGLLSESRPRAAVLCYGAGAGLTRERLEGLKRRIERLIGRVREAGADAIVMTPPAQGEACRGELWEEYLAWLKGLRGRVGAVADVNGAVAACAARANGDAAPGGVQWAAASCLLKTIFNITLERIPAFDAGADGHCITESLWKGYARKDFYVAGREGLLIEPKTAAPGRPWVWRTEFFDAFSYADMAMLEKGWHLCYYRVSDMYGSPAAVSLMSRFQDYAVKQFSLKEKAVLFGFSRGGLYAANYALAHPGRVALLYLDAPVLDIRSWPGGLGKGCGSPREWEDCLAIYGLTKETAAGFAGSPVNGAEKLAECGIPVMLVAGDADEVVPFEENGAVFARRFEKAGGKIKLILKPGVGHHPHSLEDPAPITGYILSCV